MQVRLLVFSGLLAGILGLSNLTAADEKDGFTPLFNGKDMSGWKTFFGEKDKDADPAKTWIIKDGVIECKGFPNGYFYTEKSYKSYVLRYDWRYPKEQPPKTTMNSGLLFHITGEHAIWPKCVEAQGRLKDHGQIYFLKVKGEKQFDQKVLDSVVKPQGEWNTTELQANADGSFVVKVNGTQVSKGKSELTEGQIGFQSEAAEIHFRNIVLKPMP